MSFHAASNGDTHIAALVAQASELAKGKGMAALAVQQLFEHVMVEWPRDAGARRLAIALFLRLLQECGEDEGKVRLLVEFSMPKLGSSVDAVNQQERVFGHGFPGNLGDLKTTRVVWSNGVTVEVRAVHPMSEVKVLAAGAVSFADFAGTRGHALDTRVATSQAAPQLWLSGSFVGVLAHTTTKHAAAVLAAGAFITVVVVHSTHRNYSTLKGRGIMHESAAVTSATDLVCAVRVEGRSEWVYQKHTSVLQFSLRDAEARWVAHTPASVRTTQLNNW